jgi:hypothetical protein
MRWVVAVVLVLVAAVGVTQAQIAWVGGGVGTSFEYQAQANPDKTWTHRIDTTPFLFVALPIAEGTSLRLSAGEIPYNVVLLTGPASGKLRRFTLGIDYTFEGRFADTVFSAGIGGYGLNADTGTVPKSMQKNKFGYYVGVGEWFTLSQRWRLVGEVTMHRTENVGKPTLVAGQVGLAFSF